ncbi:DUF4139 domain-containing protein [Candidatus Desantisbacteria bacterium]|nr:DUF4139 domain-containing protein [Candidatus Desantisbacteria bacterium]
MEGRILGIEPVNEIVNGQLIKQDARLVLLTDSGPIRSVNISSIVEFTLADDTIKRDLNKLLDITLDSKYTNRKQLTLTAVGEGERNLRIGYLVEMPVWKCSYRLILDSKEKENALLQGWAQAENITEEDWENINISFVAGNPLSYSMDMYSPFYIERQTVPIPGLSDLPVNWGSSLPAKTPLPEVKKITEGRGLLKRKSSFADAAQVMDQNLLAEAENKMDYSGEMISGSTPPETIGVKVGELFSYDVKEKITIPRNKAAMVPILLKQISGKRVLYYKEAFSQKPMNSYVLKNDTDLTLDAGAITFFESNTSLGEGILVHTLPPGSQEVIPYAIDVSLDIVPQIVSNRMPHFKGKIVDGILILTSFEILKTTWKLTNRGKESVTLWINQPKNNLYQLSKPEKPLKEVDNHYRFEVILKAGEIHDFVVEEKRNLDETVILASSNEETINFYLSEQYISENSKIFLKELSNLMSTKASIKRQITEWQEQAKRLNDEENRLRDNISRLNYNTPKEQELRVKWLNSLSSSEDKLVEFRGKLDEAESKKKELEEAIAKKVKEFKED